MRAKHLWGILAVSLMGTACQSQPPAQPPQWTWKAKAQAFWQAPGRYVSGLPTNIGLVGKMQVRLTVEGSQWLWNYNRARGLGKVAPNLTAAPQSADQASWQSWIDAKILFDRNEAAKIAQRENLKDGVSQPPFTNLPDPGPAPESLIALAGPVPAFAEAVVPMQHSVRFDDLALSYVDNPAMRINFAYYRFPEGVQDAGVRMKEMPQAEVVKLLQLAGINESERRIFQAVSLLEGGFESVNTYDTGFVSVGFIQFASLGGGAGSLGSVLLKHKKDSPVSYEKHFQNHGIDVTPSGELAALNIATGEVLTGASAAIQIIKDKRLIAVFQRAGRVSTENRVAQLQVAKQQYFPANDPVTITLDGQRVTGVISTVIKSEAGMATLMDRKVNTGKVDPLARVLEATGAKYKLKTFAELAKYELEIVQQLKYRKDYLLDKTLTTPVQKPQ